MAGSSSLRTFEMVKGAAEKGSFLEEWESKESLGRGVNGLVFKAFKPSEPDMGEWALKITEVKPELLEDYIKEQERLKQFENEPAAVKIEEYTSVEVRNDYCVRTYVVQRMPIYNTLPRHMSEDDVLECGIDICRLLIKCHNVQPEPILHCAIKPENILLDDGKRQYKLVDFNSVRMRDRMSSKALLRGSSMFIPPEMYENEGCDARSDIYSLGLTLYALLNNWNIPFSEGNDNNTAMLHRFNGEKFPSLPNMSRGLEKLIRKMCDNNPNKRVQTAEQVLEELRKIRMSREKSAYGINKMERERTQDELSDGEKELRKQQSTYDTYKKYQISSDSASVLPEQELPTVSWKKRLLPPLITALVVMFVGFGYIASQRVDILSLVEKSGYNPKESHAIGDTIEIGTYEQDNDLENGAEPIQWRILSIESDRMLVVSEQCLECMPFDKAGQDKWETSTLREWLNGEFMDTAFTDKEKEYILLTHNTNENAIYNKVMTETDDNVFVLSIAESEMYFVSNVERRAAPTAYALSHGITSDSRKDSGENCWWFTRSPGQKSSSAAVVYSDGDILGGGYYSGTSGFGVRPAMYVAFSGQKIAE